MIRTSLSCRAAVAVLAGAVAAVTVSSPLASAQDYDGSACAASDTRVFVHSSNGKLEVSARYWNGSHTEPVTDDNPKTVKWTVRRSDRTVVVRAVRGLVPLGGFKYVEDPEAGLGTMTNVAWSGSVELTVPAGTSYELCGDDPARESTPWPY